MEKEKKKYLFFGILSSIGRAILGVFIALWIVSSAATVQYIEFVRKIVGGRKFILTKIFSSILYIFIPVAFFLVPLGLSAVIATIFIAVDQTLVYDETVSSAFTSSANNSLSKGEKGALLFQASHHQLERMLGRFPLWSANDPWLYPQSWWDNSKNTQRGVWWATSETVRILSDRELQGMGKVS